MKFKHSFIICVIALALQSNQSMASSARYTFSYEGGKNGIYDNIKPGDTIEGAVFTTLLDDVQANFKISFSSSSENVIAQTGTNSILDMSTWIEYPNKSVFNINGKPDGEQRARVPFIIRIPDSISPGDYLGAIRVSYLSDGDLSKVTQKGAGVSVSTAIGMTLKFSIPGTRFHKLELLGISVNGFEEKNEITEKPQFNLFVKSKSSGNSMMMATLEVIAKDMLGKVIYEKSEDLGVIFAGTISERTITISNLKSSPFPGWMDIEGKLSYRLAGIDGKVFGDVFQVGIGKIRAHSLPWLFILIIATLLASIIMTLVYRRYGIRKLKSISKIYTVKKADTLQSISERFSVDPVVIIKVNKLKAPFFLSEGKEILIPKK